MDKTIPAGGWRGGDRPVTEIVYKLTTDSDLRVRHDGYKELSEPYQV